METPSLPQEGVFVMAARLLVILCQRDTIGSMNNKIGQVDDESYS
jgi:hypothetical protein